MDLDIIVKPGKDGNFVIVCPTFPECESKGATIEEALDAMIDKISETVAGNIRADLKETFRDLSDKISMNGPVTVPLMMTKLPLSLN
jgi:predicted RNase H-like HicB family nuclease